ncbi:PREDICTED: neutrophil cytosol factor 2-like [Priapulus caudatus]|uniref:Neutrophil cytosol factor 2-like n=1 Tax=Priapulus caudatus TaxID=37621 RepID=A0ABM1DYM4_PRICU|nr:PREDICTED: neutrophil cytosol factor 2-like [Priapulus caudatus]
MSVKESLQLWDKAVNEYDKGEYNDALETFRKVPDRSAKIEFNIGSIQLTLGRCDGAVKAFDNCIDRDLYLAIAYFQRGVAFFKLQRYIEAYRNFETSNDRMRAHDLIDYTQLGMRYKFCAWEALYNTALTHAVMGQFSNSSSYLELALTLSLDERSTEKLHKAQDYVKRKQVFPLHELPTNSIFRPPKTMTSNLEKKDYLGKSEVVASMEKLPSRKPSPKSSPKPGRRDASTTQTTYHNPKDKPKIALADRTPQSYGSSSNASSPSKLPKVPPISAKPSVVPKAASLSVPATAGPAPERTAALSNGKGKVSSHSSGLNVSGSSSDSSHSVGKPVDKPVIVKVHYTYTCAVPVRPNANYATFHQQVAGKLQGANISLWYKKRKTSSLQRVSADRDMHELWDTACPSSFLTLWCYELIGEEAAEDGQTSVPLSTTEGAAMTQQQATNFQDIIAELAAKSRPAVDASSSSSSSELSLESSPSKSARNEGDVNRGGDKVGLRLAAEEAPAAWPCCEAESQPYSRLSDCSSMTQVSHVNNNHSGGSSFSVSDSESDLSLSGSSSAKGVANKVKFFNARQRVLASFRGSDAEMKQPEWQSNGSVLHGRLGNGDRYSIGDGSPVEGVSLGFPGQMNIKENPSARFEEENIDSIKEHLSQYSHQTESNHMVTVETHKLFVEGNQVKRLETRIENRVVSGDSNSRCNTPKFTDSKAVLENYESLKWVCSWIWHALAQLNSFFWCIWCLYRFFFNLQDFKQS